MSFNLSKPNRKIVAGVILMGETEILDVAPIDFLHGMTHPFITSLPISDELKAKPLDIAFHYITEKGEPAKMTANMTLSATDSYESCPALDIVLIGAYFPTFTPTAADLLFIRKAYEQSTAFLTICGGVFPAVLAGVLKDHTCTGPREFLPQLKSMDPSVNWVEKRMCRDEGGKVWTSGSLLNGLDLMREFAKEFWPEMAQALVPIAGIPERSLDYDY